MFCPYCVCII